MTTNHAGPGDSGLVSQFDTRPEQVAELYDEWATADYDTDLATWNYEAPARAAGAAVEALADRTSTRFLDAGCGTGLVGVELRRLGATHIIGGDFSPASVEVARQRGVYDDVVHLDVNARLDFADDSFDAVLSVGVFSYLTDSRATVVELLRVTAPGGCVVFTQRSDLWTERDFDALLTSLLDEGACTASISDIAPYLPGHPEFGDEIGIRYVTLHPSSTS
jgi:predicted TPR repeat methyltransferase